ncbi:MAG: hypothetical protein ACKO5X_08610, partial [Limnohabitans sp.]
LDGSQVARQIEELTSVVLSSAEVSTRSAEVAANISHEMRGVMKTVTDLTSKNILHSRVILIGLLSFLIIAVGTFFAISTRLQQNIRQLDSLSLAVGKRVVELDATLATFGDATRGLGDTTEKLDSMEERQIKLDEKFQEKMEALDKVFVKMPDQIAGQVNGLTDKNLDVKLKDLQKNIQALDAKVQAMANKPAPAATPVVNNQKEVIAEIQKLKRDLEAANAAATAAALKAAAKEREREKALDKPLALPKPAPAAKPADSKAAAEAKAAEAKAIADAKAAAEAKAQAEIKAANEARAAAEAKAAAEARTRAAAEAKAAEAVRAAAQPPAQPPRAAPKEDRVIFPRPGTEN